MEKLTVADVPFVRFIRFTVTVCIGVRLSVTLSEIVGEFTTIIFVTGTATAGPVTPLTTEAGAMDTV